MKTYEKNDISGAKKSFLGIYIGIMFGILLFTDIIIEAGSISMTVITILRSVMLSAAVIVLARLLTKHVIKKFQITKSYSDNLRFNINLVIIAVAVLSLFYFLFTVYLNIQEIKDSNTLRMASIFYDEEEINEMIDLAAKEARKSFLIVWASIMAASAVAVAMEGKLIEQNCLPDISPDINNDINHNINNDTNIEQN